MTKADKLLIVIIMIVAIGFLFPLFYYAPDGDIAKVYVQEEEVLSINLSQEGTYQVQGTNGEVDIEVKNHQIRVTQENSPHHYCSLQGYVSDPNTPIVCLPNETVIRIEGDSSEDTVIR